MNPGRPGPGHIASKIEKPGKILDLDVLKIS
jgi:hypothetical protein